MYSNGPNFQIPLLASPSFFPSMFSTMPPMTPGLFAESPQTPRFDSPTLFPYSMTNTPSTSLNSLNSSADYGLMALQQPSPYIMPFAYPYLFGGLQTPLFDSSATISPLKPQETGGTEETAGKAFDSVLGGLQTQIPVESVIERTREISTEKPAEPEIIVEEFKKKIIPVINLSDSEDDEKERRVQKRKSRKHRLNQETERSEDIKKMRMTEEEETPKRITLGTFNGKKVILKLMGPRKQ